MKHLSALIAIVMLVAIPASVSLAKREGKGGGKSTVYKNKRVVVPCAAPSFDY
jgi:hypothetical protein